MEKVAVQDGAHPNGMMEDGMAKMLRNNFLVTETSTEKTVDGKNLTQRSLALTSPEPLRRRRRACIPVALSKRKGPAPQPYLNTAGIEERQNALTTRPLTAG